MAKFRMIQLRGHAAPILMALGLWLTGNSLLGMQSARGQEVTGNFKTPIPAPYYVNVINNCNKSDSCTRIREDIWGCKGAGMFDTCHDDIPQAVAVYFDKTSCTAIDPGGATCDWDAKNGNVVSTPRPDACENSSKKTGTISCLEASLPMQEYKWKKNQDLQLASNTIFPRTIQGQ